MKSGWRLGAVGFVFMVMFGILTLQLWQVQVVESAGFLEAAAASQVKVVHTPAPRGQIVDSAGRQLAGTTAVMSAVVDGALVPESAVPELVSLLAAFTGMEAAEIAEIVKDARDRGDRRVVMSNLETQDAIYLAEHREEFVGVSVRPVPQRTYPYENLASGVLGYIGKPDKNDIEDGASSTDILGKAGLEKTYDSALQGEQGSIKFQVDAFRTVLDVLGEEFPKPGNTLVLELDIELQAVLEKALVDGLDLARSQYNPAGCDPGDADEGTEDKGCPVRAVGVVLNAKDGSVMAMSSVPNFDPGLFVDGNAAEFAALPDGALTNFAVQGQYAPASTFKAVTYVMAMEENISPEGVNSVEDEILCSGQLAKPLGEGSQQVFFNWTRKDDGLQDIHTALMRSCNTYFWEVAYDLWNENKGTERENLLQNWAREVGFDAKTQIDLPFEKTGLIPDRDLFVKWADEDDLRLDPSRLAFDSPWFGGDLFQAAVGQGSVLATPIQLASSYAALVNGGTVWQPRVVREIRTEDGLLVERNDPTVLNVVEDLEASTVRALRNDLQSVVNNPRGTAHVAFTDFGPLVGQIGGKTGTAEIIKKRFNDNGDVIQDSVATALFVGIAPMSDPEYVVVVIVERGGSGGGIAAPTAKPVLQYLLDQPVTEVEVGQEAD
ncbi:MAG: penicillin-binding transpeptidase domain-containing protein [Acidimicrobiia bacterium]|nr:penicillin-binding transpeptidase domain-containing protein [Acidimicrobiia bacterium]MDX2466557.1 penicillin-binding transpeptidase domain-containing protein [Acidimicrobiia bacterium]